MPPSDAAESSKKRVVVLGAGFGGLEFCKRFRDEDFEVTLIDRENHHLFQPLLYQVATAGLSAPEIAQPIRAILRHNRNLSILMDEVLSVNVARREVRTRQGRRIGYDYLVVALGAVTGYFGKNQWEEHAPGLKSLGDATRIRRELLYAFEQAENSTRQKDIDRHLSIVVVGGGPTGVEMAGACAELARHALRKNFRRINPADAKVFLVEASNDLLDFFPPELSEYARRRLEKIGVTVLTNERVAGVGRDWVKLASGKRIDADNIIWAAGVEGNPVSLTLKTGTDRKGRIEVGPDLSVSAHPEVFAIGDIAACVDTNGVSVPGVAPAAIQMGRHVAKIIREQEQQNALGYRYDRPPFTYVDQGSMATIGRSAAVAMAGPFNMKGILAWLAWLFVHLLLLVGLRNRAAVLLQWIYSYATYRRGARIIVQRDQLEE